MLPPSGQPPLRRSRSDPSAVPLAARLAGVLMAAVCFWLGLSAVVTRSWDGRTRQGLPLHLDGEPAMWLGGCVTALGLVPLALAARTPRWRNALLAGAVLAFAACLLLAIRATRAAG